VGKAPGRGRRGRRRRAASSGRGPARRAAQGGEAGMTAASVPAGLGRSRRPGANWKTWLPYAGIAGIVIYCLTPFYWMVVSALRRPTDQFQNTVLPTHWSLANFKPVFKPEVGFDPNLLRRT